MPITLLFCGIFIKIFLLGPSSLYCSRHLPLSYISDFSIHSELGCTFWLMPYCWSHKHDFTLNVISIWWMPRVFVIWRGPPHTGFSFVLVQLQTSTPMPWSSLRHRMLCVHLGLCQPASALPSSSQFRPQLSPFMDLTTPLLTSQQLRQRVFTTKHTFYVHWGLE